MMILYALLDPLKHLASLVGRSNISVASTGSSLVHISLQVSLKSRIGAKALIHLFPELSST